MLGHQAAQLQCCSTLAPRHRCNRFEETLLLCPGLVAITSPCAVVEDYAAVVIGVVAAAVYLAGSALLKHLRVDDPLDSSAVHFFAGCWGVFCIGFFAKKDFVLMTYGEATDWGVIYGGNGSQLAIQVHNLASAHHSASVATLASAHHSFQLVPAPHKIAHTSSWCMMLWMGCRDADAGHGVNSSLGTAEQRGALVGAQVDGLAARLQGGRG